MGTLFLLAPKSKNNSSWHQRDFQTIFNSGVGPNYGISQGQITQISVGMPVVLFDRDLQRLARGTLAGYTPTTKAGNGVQRYDVKINNFVLGQYDPHNAPPRVSRFGVEIY